ncbi:MAG: hypothetical protein ABIT36_12890 [Steroidobacteraceae bacterium]
MAGSATGGAVLDTGAPGTWDDQVVGMPTVLRDAQGTYRMWFVGIHTVAPGGNVYVENGSVGLATSSDGVNWTRANSGLPVFVRGDSGAFDSTAVFHPFVALVNGMYYMWYGGADGTQGWNSVRVERIGLATSTDGVNWTRANRGQPVLDIGADGSSDSIQATGMHVLHDGRRFLMWYGAYDGLHSIVAAESPDGIHWSRLNGGRPVTGLEPTPVGVLGPAVYFDGSRFLMLYSRLVDQQWQLFGAASDDGIAWRTVYSGDALIGPNSGTAFDAAGPGRNLAVHPSQLLIENGKASLWYTGEETAETGRQRIGLLQGDLR